MLSEISFLVGEILVLIAVYVYSSQIKRVTFSKTLVTVVLAIQVGVLFWKNLHPVIPEKGKSFPLVLYNNTSGPKVFAASLFVLISFFPKKIDKFSKKWKVRKSLQSLWLLLSVATYSLMVFVDRPKKRNFIFRVFHKYKVLLGFVLLLEYLVLFSLIFFKGALSGFAVLGRPFLTFLFLIEEIVSGVAVFFLMLFGKLFIIEKLLDKLSFIGSVPLLGYLFRKICKIPEAIRWVYTKLDSGVRYIQHLIVLVEIFFMFLV